MGNTIWRGNSTTLIPTPESGDLTLADRIGIIDVYKGKRSVCEANALARGTFGTGARDGWVVNSSQVKTQKPDITTLTINWEAGGEDATMPLPCEDFRVAAVELYPKVERNAFFSSITTATLSLAYAAINGATPLARATAIDRINGLSDATQKALGLALFAKLQKGEETFYLAGCRYSWIQYSYALPTFSLGGVIESPAGPLTGYFSGVDFIRLADELESNGVNGSCFKLTSTWLGGPSGYWDTDLY